MSRLHPIAALALAAAIAVPALFASAAPGSPFVKKEGDAMEGDLDFGAFAATFNGTRLRVVGDALRFGDDDVCLSSAAGCAEAVTLVGAGDGLTGGPITSEGALALAEGGVRDRHVAPDAAIAWSKVAKDGAVLDDLGGSLAWDRLVGFPVGCRPDEVVRALAPIPACTAVRPFRGSFTLFDSPDAPGDRLPRDQSAVAVRPDGTPVVAYRATAAEQLRLALCHDAACTSRDVRTLDDGARGDWSSVALLPDGRPVVAYDTDRTDDARVAVCADAACESHALHDLGAFSSHYPTVAVGDDGVPVVAYWHRGELQLARCGDPCESWTNRTLATGTASGLAVAVVSGARPVVAHFVDGALSLLVCGDPACESHETRALGDAFPASGVAIAVAPDGRPAVAYFGPEGYRLALCDDPGCSSFRAVAVAAGAPPDEVSQAVAVAFTADGRPMMAYLHRVLQPTGFVPLDHGGGSTSTLPVAFDDRSVRLAVCEDASCSSLHVGEIVSDDGHAFAFHLASSPRGDAVLSFRDAWVRDVGVVIVAPDARPVVSLGRVAVGTSTPEGRLHVVGPTVLEGDAAVRKGHLSIAGDVALGGCVRGPRDVYAGTCLSDERLKRDVQALDGVLDDVVALRPVTFEWEPSTAGAFGFEGRSTGLVAQEVEAVLPALVEEDLYGYRAVSYHLLPLYLLAALSELEGRVDALEAENAALEERIAALEAE